MSFASKQRALSPFLIALPAVAGLSTGGCALSGVPIDELESPSALEVRLDSNVKAHLPGRQIKFFVDITNRSGGGVDFGQLVVELQASQPAAPGKVLLQEDWTFDWREQKIRLRLVPSGQMVWNMT